MNDDARSALIHAAREARDKAYAKYSQFRVGAAILTKSGETFVGCNIENASYGLTICAERVAVGNAIAAGHHQFAGLAITCSEAAAPCGACRQVLAEFCDDLPIILAGVDEAEPTRIVQLRDLLPEPFLFDPGQ